MASKTQCWEVVLVWEAAAENRGEPEPSLVWLSWKELSRDGRSGAELSEAAMQYGIEPVVCRGQEKKGVGKCGWSGFLGICLSLLFTGSGSGTGELKQQQSCLFLGNQWRTCVTMWERLPFLSLAQGPRWTKLRWWTSYLVCVKHLPFFSVVLLLILMLLLCISYSICFLFAFSKLLSQLMFSAFVSPLLEGVWRKWVTYLEFNFWMVLNHCTVFALESKGLRLHPQQFLLQRMLLWLQEEQGSMLRLSVALVCCQSKSNNGSPNRKTAILHTLLPSQIWIKFPGINHWCFPGTRTFSLSEFIQIM